MINMKCYVSICAILGFVLGSICIALDGLNSFYSLTAKDIQGNEISLEQYKGMVSHTLYCKLPTTEHCHNLRILYPN